MMWIPTQTSSTCLCISITIGVMSCSRWIYLSTRVPVVWFPLVPFASRLVAKLSHGSLGIDHHHHKSCISASHHVKCQYPDIPESYRTCFFFSIPDIIRVWHV